MMKIIAVSAFKFIHLKRHTIVSQTGGFRRVEPQKRYRSPTLMNLVSLSSKVTIITPANHQDHQLMERSLLVYDIRQNQIKIRVPDHFSPFFPTKPDFQIFQLLLIVLRNVVRHTFE
jgi:hypothetical protein